MSTTVYRQVLIYTAESTGASMERTKMPNLRHGSKGDSNTGSLDCESDILPLRYRAPDILELHRQPRCMPLSCMFRSRSPLSYVWLSKTCLHNDLNTYTNFSPKPNHNVTMILTVTLNITLAVTYKIKQLI